jgi:hypothetical protein
MMIRILTATMFCLTVTFQACTGLDFLKALTPDDPQEKYVAAHPREITDTTFTSVENDSNSIVVNNESFNNKDMNQMDSSVQRTGYRN